MFTEALRNCCGMLDPYGDMPLAGGMTASAEIDIMDTDNGVHVSVVKTPPRDGKIRLSDLLESIIGSQNGLERADDQGKRSGSEKPESVPQDKESDTNGKKDDTMDKQGPPDDKAPTDGKSSKPPFAKGD